MAEQIVMGGERYAVHLSHQDSPPSRSVTLEGNHFVVRFPYKEELVWAIKQMPHGIRQWHPDRKVWTIAANPTGIRALQLFLECYKFQVAPEVTAHIEQVTARAELMIEQSRASTTEDFIIPGIRGTLMPFQKAGVQYALWAKRCIIGDEMGTGKQQPIDSLVLTPHGWRQIGNICPGDHVIGSQGQPITVLAVYPQGIQPSYRVRFSDGSSVEAGPEHLWACDYLRGGRTWDRLVLTTKQLRARPKIMRSWPSGRTTTVDIAKTVLYLPMLAGPVHFATTRDVPIPPYTLGQLIANGSLNGAGIALSTNAADWLSVKNELESEGTVIGNCHQYSNVVRAGIPGMTRLVRSLGLGIKSPEKFVPRPYLMLMPEERLALLQGLMDGDGTARGNRITFSTTSHQLANDVRELVEGLGGIATVHHYQRSDGKRDDYQVRMRLPATMCPFRVPRKANNWRPSRFRPCRTVIGVDYVRDVESVCIAVDAPDHLYVTEHAILTHNTLQAIATAHSAGAYPALIVCPASLKYNWQREVKKWLPQKTTLILEGRKPQPFVPPAFTIINYDVLAAWQEVLTNRGYQSVIYDESHACKDGKTQRTKAAKAIARNVPYRLLLTGTPVVNRPVELVSQLQILDRLQDLGGWRHFVNRYCAPTRNQFGVSYDGAAHMGELNKKLRACCYLRRLKRDVLTELPPKTRAILPMPITNRATYAKAEADVIAWLAENVSTQAALRARAAETLVRINVLKRLAAIGKLPYVTAWIEDFMANDEKLVVFAYHQEVQQALLQAFPKAARIVAGDPARVRQANVDRFQDDDRCRLIICSLLAGGLGITLTAASNVAFCELGWTPAAHTQGEDRVHRIGARDNVTAHYLIGHDTIDEWIADLLAEKQVVVTAVTDGDETGPQSVLGDLVRGLLDGKRRTKE